MTDFSNVQGGASSTAQSAPVSPRPNWPSLDDLREAAAKLGCEVAAIQAVSKVEAGTRGGFLETGEPTCLFERHLFHRFTSGRFDDQAPELSNSVPSYVDHSYGHYSDQPLRIAAAVLLDRVAALRSTSWGLYQILGDNWSECGYPSLEIMVACMYRSVRDQLQAFVGFIQSDGAMLSALREKDWPRFAAHYNGPAYRQNGYDGALARAYDAYNSAVEDTSNG